MIDDTREMAESTNDVDTMVLAVSTLYSEVDEYSLVGVIERFFERNPTLISSEKLDVLLAAYVTFKDENNINKVRGTFRELGRDSERYIDQIAMQTSLILHSEARGPQVEKFAQELVENEFIDPLEKARLSAALALSYEYIDYAISRVITSNDPKEAAELFVSLLNECEQTGLVEYCKPLADNFQYFYGLFIFAANNNENDRKMFVQLAAVNVPSSFEDDS